MVSNSDVLYEVLCKPIANKLHYIYGDAENPLFLAKDVAEWIDYSTRQSSRLVENIGEDEKVRHIVSTLGGNQEAWFLTEDGLYEVLMQ